MSNWNGYSGDQRQNHQQNGQVWNRKQNEQDCEGEERDWEKYGGTTVRYRLLARIL